MQAIGQAGVARVNAGTLVQACDPAAQGGRVAQRLVHPLPYIGLMDTIGRERTAECKDGGGHSHRASSTLSGAGRASWDLLAILWTRLSNSR